MKHSRKFGLSMVVVATLGLAACSSGGDDTPASSTSGGGAPAAADVTITMSGWSLDTTPEFQLLADTFHAQNPSITVDLKEYDAGEYDTQMTADLAAGAAPDLYILKNLKNFVTYQAGGQLTDVSDIVGDVGSGNAAVDFYKIDGATYAVPYRQDSWFTYYNKDLFDKAGMAYPDGSWTWDDYDAAAVALTAALGDGVVGSYEHGWQSTLQGFALAQTPGADLLSGDYSYLKPYYDRVIALQDSGAQTDYSTVSTNKLTYQGQFGTQKAALMNMGSWYVATLIAQQASGDADQFAWGIAPAPQFDSSTTNKPVTFGDPTGIGINPAVDASKLDAAKSFLAFVGSEDAAVALAGIGIKPAYASDAVTAAYFAGDGVPTDDLSKFTFGTHMTLPENPVSENTNAIQNILGDAHSAIMSGSVSVDDGIAEAEKRVAAEVLN